MASINEIFAINTLLDRIFPELKNIILYYSIYHKLDEYEKEEDYNEYFILLTKLADMGCILSQKRLMNDYLLDKNLKQNHNITSSFYEINKKYSYSCSYYGWICRNSSAPIMIATNYYERAVKMGNPIAMYNLAIIVRDSEIERSIELLQKSSEWGNPRASFELAETFLESNDYEKAIDYYLDAINKGYPDKQKILILLTAMAMVFKETVVFFEKLAEYNSTAAFVLDGIRKNS